MAITVALSTQRSITTMMQSRRASLDATSERRLIEFLSLAQKTVDIAAYDLRSRAVLDAIKNLTKRVRVRIISDAGTEGRCNGAGLDPKSATTAAAIRAADLGNETHFMYADTPGAMHHKFAIRDNSAVWTGGMNFTDGGLHLEDASAIALESAELAAIYTAEFERLLTGAPAEAAAPSNLIVGKGHKVTPLFGPRIKESILAALATNAKRVRVMAYAISDPDILDALALVADSDHDIRGLYDPHGMEIAAAQTDGSANRFWFLNDPRFVAAPSNRFHLYGEQNAFGQKILIVNETVFLGSYNFSPNGASIDDDMLKMESAQVLTAATRYFDSLISRYRSYAEEKLSPA